MRLQQMKQGQYFLSLPNTLVRAKGWKKGDNIKVVIDSKGNILLRRSEVVSDGKSMEELQEGFGDQ